MTSLPQKLKMAAVLGCFGGVCSNLPDYFSNIQYPETVNYIQRTYLLKHKVGKLSSFFSLQLVCAIWNCSSYWVRVKQQFIPLISNKYPLWRQRNTHSRTHGCAHCTQLCLISPASKLIAIRFHKQGHLIRLRWAPWDFHRWCTAGILGEAKLSHCISDWR